MNEISSRDWYRGKPEGGDRRDVEVVDGQQRLITVTLIYAVLQYQLHCNLEAYAGDDGDKMVKDTKDRINKLHNRFIYKIPNYDLGAPVVVNENYNDDKLTVYVSFPEAGDTVASAALKEDPLYGVLQVNNIPQGSDRVVANAIWINRWLFHHLSPDAGTCETKASSSNQDSVRKAAKGNLIFLMNILDTMDKNVVWTTTLTTNSTLALRTFVDYNSTASKVPLGAADVIKVALISDITDKVCSLNNFSFLWVVDSFTDVR